MGRPATGQTPIHTIRVPTPIWAEAEARVGKGNMSQMIVMLIDKENRAAARRAAAEPGPVEPAPPVQAAPQATRRAPAALTEAEADELIAALRPRDYTLLSRKAKEACESLDHDAYYPVMRQLVIAGWRPAQ